jgi:hypothetical protein
MPKPKKQKPTAKLPGKLSHKGKACRRDQPINHDELKKPINLMLTPLAREKFNQMAIQSGLSRSEILERWLRGTFEAPKDAPNT